MDKADDETIVMGDLHGRIGHNNNGLEEYMELQRCDPSTSNSQYQIQTQEHIQDNVRVKRKIKDVIYNIAILKSC